MLKRKLEDNWLLLSVRVGQVIGMFPFTVNRRTSVNGDKIGRVLPKWERSPNPEVGNWFLKYSPAAFIWCLFAILLSAMNVIVFLDELGWYNFIVNTLVLVLNHSFIFGTHTASFQAARYIKLFRFLRKTIGKGEKLTNKDIIFDTSFTIFVIVMWVSLISFICTTKMNESLNTTLSMYTNWVICKFFFGIFNEMLLMRGTTVALINELRRIRSFIDCSNNEESILTIDDIEQVFIIN